MVRAEGDIELSGGARAGGAGSDSDDADGEVRSYPYDLGAGEWGSLTKPSQKPGWTRRLKGTAPGVRALLAVITGQCLALVAVLAMWRGQHGNNSELKQALPSIIPGANVWQMFRQGDVCPWTDEPEQDEDCQYRRKVYQHVMDQILQCGMNERNLFAINDRSLAHRGVPLVAPEHSMVGYQLAMKGGAGFIECDVAISKDLQLVCRHSQCDLHFTTDLLGGNHSDLAAKCSEVFEPWSPESPASARCCTYDFTSEELGRLCLIMESKTNPNASRVEDFLLGPPAWRSTALQPQCSGVVHFSEYLAWVRWHGLNAIPELKDTAVDTTAQFLASVGMTSRDFAEMLLDQLLEAGFTRGMAPNSKGLGWNDSAGQKAIMQTFDKDIALYWKSLQPTLPVSFLYDKLCDSDEHCPTNEDVRQLAAMGVEFMSPPLPGVVTSQRHRIVPSPHSLFLNSLEVGIASWSLDRSGCPGEHPGNADVSGSCGPYWKGLEGISAFKWSDILLLMYEMYFHANVTLSFSDYPAVNSLFLNCVSPV